MSKTRVLKLLMSVFLFTLFTRNISFGRSNANLHYYGYYGIQSRASVRNWDYCDDVEDYTNLIIMGSSDNELHNGKVIKKIKKMGLKVSLKIFYTPKIMFKHYEQFGLKAVRSYADKYHFLDNIQSIYVWDEPYAHIVGGGYDPYFAEALADYIYKFGRDGDFPVTGDWNGDGRDTIGIYNPSTRIFFLDYNLDGNVDKKVRFGIRDDLPIIGDWNGDGRDTIGVYRPSECRFFLDFNNDGMVDKAFWYGNPGDKPIIGDWNGDGRDTIGVYRPSECRFFLDYDNDGGADKSFTFGIKNDIPVSGDWDSDGKDTVGVWRNGRFFLKNSLEGGNSDLNVIFGRRTFQPLTGDWNGDGKDTIGCCIKDNPDLLTFLLHDRNKDFTLEEKIAETKRKAEEAIRLSKKYFPNKPTFMVFNRKAIPYKIPKNLDIIGIDPYLYPKSNNGCYGRAKFDSVVIPLVNWAKQFNKPIILIGQSFHSRNKPGKTIMPSICQQNWYYEIAKEKKSIIGLLWFLYGNTTDRQQLVGTNEYPEIVQFHKEIGDEILGVIENEKPPIAKASANPTQGNVPLKVHFYSQDSYDLDGDELEYLWDFGDGSYSNSEEVYHTYTEPDTYVATLTVSDGEKKDTDSVDITVESGNQPPYVKGEVLLKFNPDVDNYDHEKIIKEYGCSVKNVIESLSVYRVKIPDNRTVPEMVDVLNESNRIKYAEPNVIYKVQ